MKVYVNGVEEIFSSESETLGDILDHILKKEPSMENFFSKILLNDKEIPFDSLSLETRNTPIFQIETLETEICSLSQILDKNIANAQDYLKKLIPGIQKASELFRSGSEQEANKFFLNIIDGMDWFSEVVDSIAKAMDFKSETILLNGKSIQAGQESLVGWTQQMVDANRNKDWVLLADLLEYEVLPYYSEWKEHLPIILRDRAKKPQ